MRARFWVLAFLAVLAGCNSRDQQVVDVCTQAINTKLAGKSYALDAGDMAHHVTTDNEGVAHINSMVAFDAGLSTEYKQALDCRVRFENGKPPSVIYLQFDWTLDPNATLHQ